MDYRVMKRPMFKMGGPTSGGTGITSGLDTPRQNYRDAGSVLSISDAMSMGSSDIFNKALVPAMLNREKNFKSAMSIPKLQAVGSIASNVLPNIERGGLKGIVDILKDPNTINAAIQGLAQTKSLELERDKQQLADLGAIFKGKSAIESQEFDQEYKTETLSIAKQKALIKSATQLRVDAGEQSRQLLKVNEGSVSNMSEEDKILYYDLRETAAGELTPAKANQKAVLIVAAENESQKKSELNLGGSGKGMSHVEMQERIDFLTQLLIGTTTQRTDEAEGGRINKQMGGGFDMGQEQVMPATQTTAPGPEMMPQGGGQDMGGDPFTILRERLPQEIPDEVVSLIAYNKAAFQDFANIQDQDDVDLFNQKYNVQLVVDMASR
jgi:hypothetical protein